MSDTEITGPYNVIRHSDAKGHWYRVIDTANKHVTVRTFRSRKVAHRWADEANYGFRAVQRRARGAA